MVHNVISILKIGAICSSTTHKTTWYHNLQDHNMNLHCYKYNEYDSSWLCFKYLIQSTGQVYYFIIRPYINTAYQQIIDVLKCQQTRMSVTFSHNNYNFRYSLTTQSLTNFSLCTLQLHKFSSTMSHKIEVLFTNKCI